MMAHNCNTFNTAKASSDGSVTMVVDLDVTQKLSIYRAGDYTLSLFDFNNGMYFPFPVVSPRARLYTSGVTYTTATAPTSPFTSVNQAQSFTISGAGTYLLQANAYFIANGAIATLRWKDTTGATLGPKTRHQTSGMRFANKVWGIVTFTDSSRTVYVEVSEESGSLRTEGQTQESAVIYATILQLT